jgi:hypothetical protein
MDTTLLANQLRWHHEALFIGPDTREERKKLSFINISLLQDSLRELPNASAYTVPFELFQRLLNARNPLVHDAKKSRRRLVQAAIRMACVVTEVKTVLLGDIRNPFCIFLEASNAWYDKAFTYSLEMDRFEAMRWYKQRHPDVAAVCCPYCVYMGRDMAELQQHIPAFHGGLLVYAENLQDPYSTSTDDDEI